jgi:hypothetical protein
MRRPQVQTGPSRTCRRFKLRLYWLRLATQTTERHGVNAVNVDGKRLLLTETSGGTVVHLTAAVEPAETGRGAVPDHYFHPDGIRIEALIRPGGRVLD